MKHNIKDITEFSDNAVAISWEDGHESIYLYEDLRSACPCAKCTGHSGKPRFKKKIPVRTGTGDTGIRALKTELVGHYAVKFYWSDRHDTGIYPFDYLRDICECEQCVYKENE